MTEKELKDLVVNQLKDNVRSYSIEDFPINIADYMPSGSAGAILVKSIGRQPVRYMMQGNIADVLNFGDYISVTYRIGLVILASNITNQDEILELTESVINSIISIDTSDLMGAGSRFLLEMVQEVGYNVQKGLLYRTLTFTLPCIEWADEMEN